MRRPIVGIPACAKLVNGMLRHDTPARYAEAVLGGADAVPIMIPPLGEAALQVLDVIDGLLVPGSPSNVHPDLYQGGVSQTPELHDPARDATSLPLIRAAIARGMPVLAICRGIQELNVALGGTLNTHVHELPGRIDHRAPYKVPLADQYAPTHQVNLTPGGALAELAPGCSAVMVNSLHWQGVDRLAPGLTVEATAPDGTIEGVRVQGAPAFALGVQWHPEWEAAKSPFSTALFSRFGDAARARRQAR